MERNFRAVSIVFKAPSEHTINNNDCSLVKFINIYKYFKGNVNNYAGFNGKRIIWDFFFII